MFYSYEIINNIIISIISWKYLSVIDLLVFYKQIFFFFYIQFHFDLKKINIEEGGGGEKESFRSTIKIMILFPRGISLSLARISMGKLFHSKI